MLRAVKRSNPIKNKALYLMMLPGLIYLLVNNYLPMAGLVVAFKNYDYSKGIFGSDWAGIQNFIFLFKTSSAYLITRNTILYNVAFIVINTAVGVFLAVMLNEIKRRFTIKLFQTFILLPYLISMIVVSYIVFAIFSTDTGYVNNSILPMLGIKPVSWYSEPKYWSAILVIVNTWKQFGFLTIVYYASVIAIDYEYFEAAILDGAGKLKQIRYITLPMIRPVIITMTLLSIGRIFYSDFGLFYQVPRDSGALYTVTNTIDTYVYRALITLGDVGMASAACFYQSVVGFILVLLANLGVRKIDPDNAMF